MANLSLWKGQSSRAFLAGVLLISILLFFAAEKVGEQGHAALYGTLNHLAAMFLAAFIAATFFAFRDVREMFAASTSSLLVQGEIVRHLAPTLRRTLRDRLLLEDLSSSVEYLQPELREHLESIERQSLSLPHHYGFSATVTLRDDPSNSAVLRSHTLETYKVSARHCRNAQATYHLRIYSETSNPHGTLATGSHLGSFSVRAGGSVFTVADAVVTPKKSAGLDVVVISLERDVVVNGEVDIRIEYESTASRADPTEIRAVRYPTSGFRCALLYNDRMTYDVSWFKAVSDAPNADLFNREEVELTPGGITASTQKWLMPGEGVTLYWFPKAVSAA